MVADNQTLTDLEFPLIREWASTHALGKTAIDRIVNLVPFSDREKLLLELGKVKELFEIRTTGESFPTIDFDELLEEILLLPIKNAVIQLEGFMRIRRASELCNQLMVFFDKRENDYPLLSDSVSIIHHTTELNDAIDKVFDRQGKIRDDASEVLQNIRNDLKITRNQINRNFERELRRLTKENILGDTRETYINERRVLTVLSSHKRMVNGNIIGTSKTGNLTYIEPGINIPLNNELEQLLDDERKEIFRILQSLKSQLNQHIELIKNYQLVLTEFDFIKAKVVLALELHCQLPTISEEIEFELIEAYHPILRKNNQQLKKQTLAQHISMDRFSRMLVISGPNAGGKSITLKSIGLLQVMLQSGFLVPVHENSRMCIFQRIMSDIGDNQSIANELSTYSYRLKRMKAFLDLANRKTLLLLDEFGTGSDPELGGALAEAIFERLYNKKCFGVMTTHYANIKLKADRLKNALNACMLFDTETLSPLYKLSIGQPGSSFTFEVAKINGLPDDLIEEAKEKLDPRKVKMDTLLIELQKEKNYFSRLNNEHLLSQSSMQKAITELDDLQDHYESKLSEIRKDSDENQKLIQAGKKLKSFIERYQAGSRKKDINLSLLEEIRKYIAMEKTKIDEQEKSDLLKKRMQKPARKKKNTSQVKEDKYHREKIVNGSKVKLISTKQSGVVEEINGDNITVSFGFLRMKVTRDKLMWID